MQRHAIIENQRDNQWICLYPFSNPK